MYVTIKTRNISILILFFVSVVTVLAACATLVYMIKSNSFIAPYNSQQKVFLGFTASKYTFLTSLISIFVLLVYVSFTAIYFVISFEKTQSTEIIFFSLFLVACLCESIRILIPILDLWDSTSYISLIIGKIEIFGRTLAPLSLLAVAIASGTEQRQDVERNIAIIVITSVTIVRFLPIDSMHISLQCLVPWSRNSFFSVMRLFIILAADISQIINAELLDRDFTSIIGFIILSLGYLITCITFSFFTLILGTILLSVGSVIYLRGLHKQYLWQ